jgi:NAD(P)H-dependent flavin oxidoreductase YrpB (nitropropane dioxygenase family)
MGSSCSVQRKQAPPIAVLCHCRELDTHTNTHTNTCALSLVHGYAVGAQVSSWKLAREVARAGELGIISGTAMEVVLLRWMQDGDPDGLYRRALSHFPDQDMVKRFMDKYYIEGGKSKDQPYRPIQMWQLNPTQELREACVLGNFAEVCSHSARRHDRVCAAAKSLASAAWG